MHYICFGREYRLSSTVIVPSKSVKKINCGLVSMYGRATDPIVANLR